MYLQYLDFDLPIICGISRRVPRVYLRDGAPVRIWNDLEET